jgi:hypothetical protein
VELAVPSAPSVKIIVMLLVVGCPESFQLVDLGITVLDLALQ